MFNTEPFGQGQFAEAALPLWAEANFAQETSSKKEDMFFAAFGRFMAAYSLADAGFHIAVRHFSKLPDDWARLVFGGMRMVDVIKNLRAFISGTSSKNAVDELVEHFNDIGDARDQFAHRIFNFDTKGSLRITDELTCKVSENSTLHHFTLPELMAMALDCQMIFGRLIVECGQMNQLHHSGLAWPDLLGSWHYIRPQPETPSQPAHSGRKERKRQRRASQASQQSTSQK
jgi:hypothetical protein